MSQEQARKLAIAILEACCIEGIRSESGRYTRINNEEILLRRLTNLIVKQTRSEGAWA